MRIRPLLGIVGALLLGAAPAALGAGVFGAVEVVDPVWRPLDLYPDDARVLAVGPAGNPLWATFARSGSKDQMAVYERCGPSWQRSLLGSPTSDFSGTGLRMGADGTATAVWREGATYSSSTRPPGGEWGAPQTIVSDKDVTSVRFAVSDDGRAIAVWVKAGLWASTRPAGGSWGTAEKLVDTAFIHDVAMSPTGDAVVVYQAGTPGWAFSRYRPAGGSWGAPAEVLRNGFQNTMKNLRVEFDGVGRTVAMAAFNETITDALRVNVGTAGAWGATDKTYDDLEPDTQQFRFRNVISLVRHPQGILALWRRHNSSGSTFETVAMRLGAASWDAPQPLPIFDAAGATTADGELLVAGVAGDPGEIRAARASSLAGAWSAPARVSPAASVATNYRPAVAAGGGTAFLIGWGVHGAGNQRSEIISSAASATCAGSPSPTVTATASPSPDPEPLPPVQPSPSPTATAEPTVTPLALADFATLPAATKCVPGRKLTLKFKRASAVRTVAVKLNAKRVATLKGAKVRQPYVLRKLPKGTFTVTVTITTTSGKQLTERRRYKTCR